MPEPGFPLVGIGGAQDRRFVERPAYELEANRQAPAGDAAGNRDGRKPGERRPHREDIREVHRDGILQTFAERERRRGAGGQRDEIDLGERRTIVSGIAAHYAPEALVGRQVIIIANLRPAKLMGVISQGMLLTAESDEGPALILPEKPVAPGTALR